MFGLISLTSDFSPDTPRTSTGKSNIATDIANILLPFNTFKWSQIYPTIYDQILNLAKTGCIVPLLQSISLMNPLFYSIRNNWCQI